MGMKYMPVFFFCSQCYPNGTIKPCKNIFSLNRQDPVFNIFQGSLKLPSGRKDCNLVPFPCKLIAQPQNMPFNSAFLKTWKYLENSQLFHPLMIHSAALLASLNPVSLDCSLINSMSHLLTSPGNSLTKPRFSKPAIMVSNLGTPHRNLLGIILLFTRFSVNDCIFNLIPFFLSTLSSRTS